MTKKGVSLYFVMVVLFLLLGVALGISTVITSQITMIRSSGDSVIAEAAAEAGVEEGLYLFFTHGGDQSWVGDVSGAFSNTIQRASTCGVWSGTTDPYHYTGSQIIASNNSKYRFRFYYDKGSDSSGAGRSFEITAAGYYPAQRQGETVKGKDISLRVVSASWK